MRAPAKTVPATKPPRQPHRRVRSSQASRPGTAKPTGAPAKPRNAAGQLAKIAATIAEAADLVATATRDKDAEKLKAAIADRARAERRGGLLLIALAGRVKPLPGVSKLEAKRWRRAAVLSEKDFEGKIQRAQRKAVTAIGARPKEKAAKPRDKKLAEPAAPPDGAEDEADTLAAGAGRIADADLDRDRPRGHRGANLKS